MRVLDHPLNDAQRAAVVYDQGPLLILAGAGSGKTRVITHRLAYRLERGARPDAMVAMTFTNKAAREMKERLHALSGAGAERVRVSTFHSACARWLRRNAGALGRTPNFSIYDEDDQLALLRDVSERLGHPSDAAALRETRAKLERTSHEAKRTEELEEAARSDEDERFAHLHRTYLDALRRANAFDFGTMVSEWVLALEADEHLRARIRASVELLVVDEFQDTNTAQYRLLQQLMPADGDVAVVGDDDQSIYRWRGATVENVFAFQRDYAPCEVVTLEENYRSSPVVLEAAHAVVKRVGQRMPKELFTQRTDRGPVVAFVGQDDAEEADFVARTIERERIARGLRYSDFAVFVRTNAQTRILEERLRRAGVQHEVVGSTSFFGRKEIKDVLAFVRLAANPRDDVAFLRVANVPARGLGAGTLSKVRRLRDEADFASMRDASRAILMQPKGLATRAQSALRRWLDLVDVLVSTAEHGTASELLETVLTETQYVDALLASKDADAEDRVQNIADLQELARTFDDAGTIAEFLELTALDRATTAQEDESRVAIMTVHASKGLEYPVVFVTGLEDNTFPLRRRDGVLDAADEDEERRLCYVAFTRAQHALFISGARRRRLYGRWQDTKPSPYLAEVPAELVSVSAESAPGGLNWSRGPEPRAQEGKRHSIDEFDQRPWQERLSDAMAVVPEEGLVFDDRCYPEDVFEAANQNVGRRVRHRIFGVGQVRSAERTSGKTRLTIDFGERGQKNVVMEYVEFLD